VAEWSKAALC